MSELSRGDFLKLVTIGGTGLIIEGCQSAPIPTEPTAKPEPQVDRTAELLALTQQEVLRLVKLYPEDSIVRTVYLGDLTKISPVFPTRLNVGIADPKVYATISFGKPQYSDRDRFRYSMQSDNSVVGYSTLNRMEMAVFFSPFWTSSQETEVKLLALEKEALTIAQWEGFSKIALDIYLRQGKIEKLDQEVTEREISWTLARNLLIDNSSLLKLYDYASYLLLLPRVESLLQNGDQARKELGYYLNLGDILQKAKDRGIQYNNLTFNSPEFYRVAFGSDSAWAKMIADSSVPGPAPIRQPDRLKVSRRNLLRKVVGSV